MNILHDAVPPSAWVCRFAHLIASGGQVLDLACGQGRHSRYLADLGLNVTALDRDQVALAGLAGQPRITPLLADVENGPWPLEGRQFDGIIITNYLWRPLMARIFASLAPGGVYLHETFMLGNEAYGKPSNPAFLLKPYELLDLSRASLHTLAFEQGEIHTPKPAMIQRICAVAQGAGRLSA